MRTQKHDTRHGRHEQPERRPTPQPVPGLIAVGVDGGAGGRDAAALGSMLARSTAAELMLISIFEEPLLEGVVPPGMGWRAGQRQARAMLAQTRDSLAPDARTAVRPDALVWRGLRELLRLEHRDLLILGSGRRARDGHIALGNTAEELLCELECPLALAPRGARDRAETRLRRVGVGFDDTPESRAAVELAGAIAMAADAELHLRGVVNDRVAGGLRTEQIVLGGEAIVADHLSSLSERAAAAVRAIGAQTRIEVMPGSVVESLRALSDRVDLLVIGSGHSGPSGRVQLGTTGRELVNDAASPIVLAPRSSHASTV